jgi:hypothetical protein
MIINHSAIIVTWSLIVNLEAMILHLCYNISRKPVKKYPSRFDKTQSKLSFEAKREGQAAVGEGSSGDLVIAKFNASKIRVAISKMIIMDELPFRFVEGERFQDFMKMVEPRFSIPSHFTIMRDCFKLFMSEK